MIRDLLGRFKVRPAVVVAAILALLALLGLTTDLFRSSRSVVRDAATGLTRPLDAELRFIVDVRARPDPKGTRFHRLHFRAGPGPLLQHENALPNLQFPFRLILARRGVTLTFLGESIIREGAGYVRMREMPAYGELGKTLEGRWLQVSDRREPSGRSFSDEERSRLAQQVFSSDILREIRRGSVERVRDVRARSYRLAFDEERLLGVLQGLPQQFPDSPALVNVARFLEGRLRVYTVDRAELWVRPRSHELVRVRLELVPRRKQEVVQRVIVDATILPRTIGDVPDAPQGAVRLRPETLQKLLPR